MKGALLVNLGSPDSTEVKDVKKYLKEFLMDERVIDEPLWLRTLLVKGIILNFRPKKSAKAYKKILWDEGSPLIVLSYRLLEKVKNITSIPVALSMRYGNPSIKSGIQELVDKGVTEILLIPLYPQHAMASTETILALADKIKNEFNLSSEQEDKLNKLQDKLNNNEADSGEVLSFAHEILMDSIFQMESLLMKEIQQVCPFFHFLLL